MTGDLDREVRADAVSRGVSRRARALLVAAALLALPCVSLPGCGGAVDPRHLSATWDNAWTGAGGAATVTTLGTALAVLAAFLLLHGDLASWPWLVCFGGLAQGLVGVDAAGWLPVPPVLGHFVAGVTVLLPLGVLVIGVRLPGRAPGAGPAPVGVMICALLAGFTWIGAVPVPRFVARDWDLVGLVLPAVAVLAAVVGLAVERSLEEPVEARPSWRAVVVAPAACLVPLPVSLLTVERLVALGRTVGLDGVTVASVEQRPVLPAVAAGSAVLGLVLVLAFVAGRHVPLGVGLLALAFTGLSVPLVLGGLVVHRVSEAVGGDTPAVVWTAGAGAVLVGGLMSLLRRRSTVAVVALSAVLVVTGVALGDVGGAVVDGRGRLLAAPSPGVGIALVVVSLLAVPGVAAVVVAWSRSPGEPLLVLGVLGAIAVQGVAGIAVGVQLALDEGGRGTGGGVTHLGIAGALLCSAILLVGTAGALGRQRRAAPERSGDGRTPPPGGERTPPPGGERTPPPGDGGEGWSAFEPVRRP